MSQRGHIAPVLLASALAALAISATSCTSQPAKSPDLASFAERYTAAYVLAAGDPGQVGVIEPFFAEDAVWEDVGGIRQWGDVQRQANRPAILANFRVIASAQTSSVIEDLTVSDDDWFAFRTKDVVTRPGMESTATLVYICKVQDGAVVRMWAFTILKEDMDPKR
jgi:ketosteroid isomerase-like protein